MTEQTTIRIGHYVLGRTIGQGSFGKVKLAQHEITGHKVAVKMLNRQKLATKVNGDMKIKREIRILKLLRHPHIIRLYEVIETPTDIFVVMEYVEGGELFDFIVKNGKLSETQARQFFQQMICALEHVHHFRIVHRDLKPENLLLDKEEKLRIADFGLSTLTSDGNFLSTSCGSPNYAAPEIVSGKLYAGPEVDVWSCGVILYAFICGRLPFDEDSTFALFKKIREGMYFLPHNLPRPCRDLIKRMLEVDPLKRITIPQIREHEWFQDSLPTYLSLSPEETLAANRSTIWDTELLRFVAKKMDIPEDIAHRALLNGTKNDISVAYHILLDARRPRPHSRAIPMPREEQHAPTGSPLDPQLKPSPVMESVMTPLRGLAERQAREQYNEPSSVGHSPSLMGSILSTTPSNFSFGSTLKEPFRPLRVSTPIGIPIGAPADPLGSPLPSPGPFGTSPFPGMSSSLGAYGQLAAALAQHRSSSCSSAPESPVVPVHQNWRLGLFTALPGGGAMRTIYGVLRGLGLRWKVYRPYHLLCRPLNPALEKDGDLVVGVELLRMMERHDEGFLVDMYILSSDVLPALDLIHRLYRALHASIGA